VSLGEGNFKAEELAGNARVEGPGVHADGIHGNEFIPIEGLGAGVAASELLGLIAAALAGHAFGELLVDVETSAFDLAERVVVATHCFDCTLRGAVGTVRLNGVEHVGSAAEVVDVGPFGDLTAAGLREAGAHGAYFRERGDNLEFDKLGDILAHG
jgi:hypothetical protein